MTENQTGILSPEQAERIKARDRKRKQRERERNAESATQEETPEAYWQRNISAESSEKITTSLTRQEVVFDKLHWMEHQIDGSYHDPTSEFYADPNDETVYVSLESGVADLKADVAEHGVCNMEVYLLGFWKGPNSFAKSFEKFAHSSEASRRFYQQIQEGKFPNAIAQWDKRATGTFMRFGLVTAIPSHRLYEFENWLKSTKSAVKL